MSAVKRFLVATILVVLLAGGFLALGVLERSSAADTSYSPRLPNRRSLIVRAHDALQGFLLLRQVVRRLISGVDGDTARLKALVEWTHENVRPQYASPHRLVRDDMFSVLRRGFGYCDQSAHVFATLATFAGYQARLLFVYDARGDSPHTVAQVRLGNRWVVADPWLGALPVDPTGAAMTVEELAARPDLFRAQLDYSDLLQIGIAEFQRGRPFWTFPYASPRSMLDSIVSTAPSMPFTASLSAAALQPREDSGSANAAAPADAFLGQSRAATPSTDGGWTDALTYDRARRAHLRGDYADALIGYRSIRLSDLEPELADAIRFFTGLALFRSGRLAGAIDEFSRAIELSPSSAWRRSILRYRGEVRIILGEEAGIDDLEDSDTPRARRLLKAMNHAERR